MSVPPPYIGRMLGYGGSTRALAAPVTALASLIALVAALAGCAAPLGTSHGSKTGATGSHTRPDPDRRLAWGPTVGQLQWALHEVSGWSPQRLAGQVIVGRYLGSDADGAAAMVRRLHLAGLCVTPDNFDGRTQLLGFTQAVASAEAADGRQFPPVIGVDEEGGEVEHLRGVATDFPSFSTAGRAIEAEHAAGRHVVRRAARWTGLELRTLGFTWIFAPDADVTIGAADVTIGNRSASEDPQVAALAAAAAVTGYDAAGVVSTLKHFPGHGSVTTDSHIAMPVLDSSIAQLQRHDLPPFLAGIRAGAPAVMVSHIDVKAIDHGQPSSLSPQAYAYLRKLGFDGVAITDSLGMGAVTATPEPAVHAILAGADLLLMPADTRVAHRQLTAEIRSGRIPRSRILDAASKVVAMQLWQKEQAAAVPVPDDVRQETQAASDALSEAG